MEQLLREEWSEYNEHMTHVAQEEESMIAEWWLSSIKKRLDQKRKDMKRTHLCAFNDGECECKCYLEALDEVIKMLK